MHFPIKNNKYEVVPGLRKMATEEKIFLVNENYEEQNELRRWTKTGQVVHECLHIVSDILNQLQKRFIFEYPNLKIKKFWDGMPLEDMIQDDICIIKEIGDTNQVIYLDVAFPNGWDPRKKIGRTFAEVHEPVAHFENMAKNQNKIVKAMIDSGPFERFAWGIHTTDTLNRLEVPDNWKNFEEIYFRVERQTTLGFPAHRAALFTINTDIKPISSLSVEQKEQIALAVESMDAPAREYKGIGDKDVKTIVKYMRSC